jgi:hypothetical protein
MMAIFLREIKAQDTIFNYNPQWTSFYYLNDSISSHSLDTSIDVIQRYHPAEFPFGYLHLGYLGAAATPMYFIPSHSPSFDVGFHQFDVYWLTSDEVRFYDSKRPFTVVSYQQGAKAEIVAGLSHTQNITPQWSAGMDFKRMRMDGYYQRQLSRISNFDVFTRYASKNGLYNLNIAYILNSVKVNENGGVEDAAIFSDTTLLDKSVVEVRLDSAMNTWKNDAVVIQNSINLGPWEMGMRADTSATTTDSIPQKKSGLSFVFNILSNGKREGIRFYDGANDFYFYDHHYWYRKKTRDTVRYDRISNEFRVRLLDSKKPFFKDFRADGWVHHDIYNLESQLPDEQIQNAIAGLEIKKYFGGDSTGSFDPFLLKFQDSTIS